jgi:hypothetical protein
MATENDFTKEILQGGEETWAMQLFAIHPYMGVSGCIPEFLEIECGIYLEDLEELIKLGYLEEVPEVQGKVRIPPFYYDQITLHKVLTQIETLMEEYSVIHEPKTIGFGSVMIHRNSGVFVLTGINNDGSLLVNQCISTDQGDLEISLTGGTFVLNYFRILTSISPETVLELLNRNSRSYLGESISLELREELLQFSKKGPVRILRRY